MRIIRLELRGYIRLGVCNIDHLIYTPESNYQLILGTNGSGKSSLIYELSPLPAHHSQYTKDGLKHITIEHRGATYQLISDFKTGKHSFSIDGDENLNRGGTQQVQLQLVSDHFNGYNRELHDILTDEVVFTRMPINERRAWIQTLSTQDYTWSMALHKKLASQARDRVGAVKHINNRQTEIRGNLKALGSVDGLSERALQLREEMNALLISQSPEPRSAREMEVQLRQILDNVAGMSRRVVDMVHSLRYSGPVPMQDIDEIAAYAAEADRDAVAKKALADRLAAEYTEIETTLHGFRTSDGITPENIETHLLELRERLAEQRALQDEMFGPLDDADMICMDNEHAIPAAINVFMQLPDNEDRLYSRQVMDQRREQFRNHQDLFSSVDGRLMSVNRRISIIEQARETNCPSCGYVWREGVSAGELEELKAERARLAVEVESASKGLHKLQEYLERAAEVGALYTEYRSLTASYTRLRPLWEHIGRERMHMIQPASHIHVFHRWTDACMRARELQKLLRREKQLEDLAHQWAGGDGIGHLGQRMVAIVKAIEEETVHLNEKRRVATRASDYLADVNRLSNTVDQLSMLADQIDRQKKRVIDAYRDEAIGDLQVRHHNEMAAIQSRLTEHGTLAGLVRDLESDLESTTASRDALQLLAKALSPTDGLIAEQLSGFIGCLVAQLNSIISSIWTYDLQVRPCGLTSGELDYKFPMVAGAGAPVFDVCKGSKGQKQVVDFSFKLTVMLYKNIMNFPLYLDEPGEGFDEQHRTQLMSFIKQLMDTGDYSQLFMVSHYASNHGAFNQADVTVLDSSNIAVAGVYNQHVVLG